MQNNKTYPKAANGDDLRFHDCKRGGALTRWLQDPATLCAYRVCDECAAHKAPASAVPYPCT